MRDLLKIAHVLKVDEFLSLTEKVRGSYLIATARYALHKEKTENVQLISSCIKYSQDFLEYSVPQIYVNAAAGTNKKYHVNNSLLAYPILFKEAETEDAIQTICKDISKQIVKTIRLIKNYTPSEYIDYEHMVKINLHAMRNDADEKDFEINFDVMPHLKYINVLLEDLLCETIFIESIKDMSTAAVPSLSPLSHVDEVWINDGHVILWSSFRTTSKIIELCTKSLLFSAYVKHCTLIHNYINTVYEYFLQDTFNYCHQIANNKEFFYHDFIPHDKDRITLSLYNENAVTDKHNGHKELCYFMKSHFHLLLCDVLKINETYSKVYHTNTNFKEMQLNINHGTD